MAQARNLPARPSLEYLKKLAKRQVAAARLEGKATSLAPVQLAIARQFGFTSWRKLKAHVDRLSRQRLESDRTPDTERAINLPHVFRDVMKAIVRRDNDALTALLARVPEVVNRTGPHPQWGGRPQPLHVAIETGNGQAFAALLKAGADIDGDNAQYDGWSPLMLAVHWKRNAMRDELLRRGARVDLVAALMLKDDRRVARLLTDPSVLKGPVANDATPLHFARTVKAARLLIARGVETAARNKYGKTAAEVWAGAKPRSAGLMRLAESLGPRLVPDLCQAVEQGRMTVVRKMLARGADANSRFPDGSRGTLLHAAAWNGNLAMVRLLVAKGADVQALDEEHKNTPAGWARHAQEVFAREGCGLVAEYLEGLMRA